MQIIPQLADYPQLRKWFEQWSQSSPDLSCASDFLLFRLCDALDTIDTVGVRRWLDAFRLFLQRSQHPLEDFLTAEALAETCGTQIMELIGLIAEQAILRDQGDLFFDAMKAGAESTRLVVFRFFAAWTALNIGRLEQCVGECEKVDQPYAPIYTLQGQALLELGRQTEAVEVLDVATQLAANEPLGWFQLAKAHHVGGDPEKAFAALRKCKQISPNNLEVSLYMAMIALESNAGVSLAEEATDGTNKLLAAYGSNPTVVFTLLGLACRTGRKADAVTLLNQVNWGQMSVQSDLLRTLPRVLRRLHDVGWIDIASKLLSGITPAV